MDACFQCKLCEVQCPYTPREKHEFQLDFPKLVHRYKAQRAKQRGHPAARPPARQSRRRRRDGAAELRHGQRDEPREPRTARSWRRPSASTGTSCCPTSRPRRSRSGPRAAGACAADAAGQRGRALPDLLRPEQRAADRPRHARGAGAQPGDDGLREGPAVLRHAGVGDGRPRLGPQAGGEQPQGRSRPSSTRAPRSWPSTRPAP